MQPIYLDYNATTPVSQEVASAMQPYIESRFGNPSSTHCYGTETKKAVEIARAQVASLIGCNPAEIVFTSGGTESNNYAIKGAALASAKKGNHIITSSIEHPAVFEVCKYLEKKGFEISWLPVDEYGIVDPAEVEKTIRPTTVLISIMHANNETGSIQPIEAIGKIATHHNILFHSDAAQSLGKIKTDVNTLHVDLLSIAGHKLYAPKGIGALYIRSGVMLEKLIHGADHEQNLRAGTENVIEIVGLGKACEIAAHHLKQNAIHYQKTRNYLHELISHSLPECKLNGHPEKRLPNTLSLSFPGVEANTLLNRLENIAASAGAACHAESIDVSAVLQAMKVPLRYAMGTLRFSTGRETTLPDIKQAAQEIIETARQLMPEHQENNITHSASIKNIKLTHYTHGLGCACKIEPRKLEEVLQLLPSWSHPDILVGTETSDDATVYRINDSTAIVQTLDFFTPIADDPYDFGAIAAANALSDIYAMGAVPLFALNIVGFPENQLPMEVLHQILKGAQEKAAEAGIGVLGGHSIEDPEPKFGMVVTGIVDPQKVIKNYGALPGDCLILTKPLGLGILTTAIKRGLVEVPTEKKAMEVMKTLNKAAAELMLRYKVHACTDVTGFGLLGHLYEMTKASKCNISLTYDHIPIFPEATSLATAGVIPGGTHKNHAFIKNQVNFNHHPLLHQMLLCDAQTSGGLLIAMPASEAEQYVHALNKTGNHDAAVIGVFTEAGEGKISIL